MTKKDDIKKSIKLQFEPCWAIRMQDRKAIFDDIEKWRDDFLSNLNLGPTEFPYQQITEGLNELKKKWLE